MHGSCQIVGQLSQQQRHFLTVESFFCVCCTKALFRAFVRRFDSATVQVTGIDSSPDRVNWGKKSAFALLAQPVDLVIIQIKDEKSRFPLLP